MNILLALVVASAFPLSDEVAEKLAQEKLSTMTLEEKGSLCGLCATMYMTTLPRIGITNEWALSDASHGIKPEHGRKEWAYVDGVDNRSTILPCMSALAATWNRELAAAEGGVMAEQMRARGKNQQLGPGLNIMRNPLCGRNWEYFSEDPYLVGEMAVEYVKAVQSHGMASTPKHFCLNSQEWNRFKANSTIADRALEEIYLPAFEKVVVEGKALSLMTAYNQYNGTFCSENAYLQKAILRDRWGFKGMIVTDWGGQHSCDFAVMNGGGEECDQGKGIRFLTDYYGTAGEDKLPLVSAVKAGRVPEEVVDDMVYRILYVMAKTGFLSGKMERGSILTEAHRATAQRIGEEAVVLVRNDELALPLVRAKTKKLVVFGQIANLKQAHLGSSCEARTDCEVTFLQGLRDYLGNSAEIAFYPLGGEADVGEPTAIDPLMLETVNRRGNDAFVERAWERRVLRNGKEIAFSYVKDTKSTWSHNCSLPGKGEVDAGDIVEWHAEVKAPESGEYAFMADQSDYSQVSIEVDGKLIVDRAAGKAKGLISLADGKVYAVTYRMYVGDAENFCKFGWAVPSSRRDAPDKVLSSCRAADAVLVFTGTTLGHGRAKETEGADRPNMLGSAGHAEEIAKILSWKLPRTVVICRSGSAVEMPYFNQCRTFVHTSYLGQEAGRILPRVLFGEVNPSGKMTFSWPKRYADTPTGHFGAAAYNATNSVYLEGIYVGYRWYEKRGIDVDIPFGHGLSYTTFKYGEEKLTPCGNAWRVEVPVTNIGEREGAETVQLYVAPRQMRIDRPCKELKGFVKLRLKPGETKNAVFTLTRRDLAYWSPYSRKFQTDPGEYEIILASSLVDWRAFKVLTIAEE